MPPGVPLWRLRAPNGQVRECFVDPAGTGEWLLTLWNDQKLHHSEIYPTEAAGAARAGTLRSDLLANGWMELRVM